MQPKERLVIFGAEPDVPPLALMAHQVGLEVIIWDWRQSYLKQALFPNATLYGEMSITSFLKKIAFHSRDSVVIMTHNFMIDKEILQTLRMNDNIHYLGVLGPKKRTKRLLNTTSIPKSIHSPVGIAIGAEGPEEIAISILAEVIQQNRQALDKGVSSLEAGKNSRNISRSG
ncbi:XdhC family protein [Paracerasibacillus soli]|uniref:XdhC family protein n=1 Tax=Paracerasibacillus soli TaxID=480284 RepID=A0ABU5CQG9_9BACI|nr:XdhC family protein [Virgibacillus soli]MDY0407710.1 XdhC family protein [Virgibacillus soli]